MQLDQYGPAAAGIALHDPMRQYRDGLMHQFEVPFRLADGLNRVGPNARRLRQAEADVDAQVLVDQIQIPRIVQVELPTELPKPPWLPSWKYRSSAPDGNPEKLNSMAKWNGRPGGKPSIR